MGMIGFTILQMERVIQLGIGMKEAHIILA